MNQDEDAYSYDAPLPPDDRHLLLEIHEAWKAKDLIAQAALTHPVPSPPPSPTDRTHSPGSITPSRRTLLTSIDSNYVHPNDLFASPTATEHSTAMMDQPDGEALPAVDGFAAGTARITLGVAEQASDSDSSATIRPPPPSSEGSLEQDRNELAIVPSNDPLARCEDPASRTRVDSAHADHVQQDFSDRSKSAMLGKIRSSETSTYSPVRQEESTRDGDRSDISPTLRKHRIHASRDSTSTLPPLETTVSNDQQDGPATSPQTERLPSFNQLYELANTAARELPHAAHHSHKLSSGSTISHSSLMTNHLAGTSAASPVSVHRPLSATSPTTTSTMSQYYGSPQQMSGPQPYYAPRRLSNARERLPLHPPPSLPSASSSSEGCAGSSSEGYSTNHTTPSDHPEMPDVTSRVLPPVQGMPAAPPPPPPILVPGPYVCDDPGCAGATFQTQYLLNSHKNVHSHNRPHYCPVPHCSRSVGGKGFKRKNEMIRHGLVHNSPGYVCPFCPEREHKYPRPDNLQRHVRVHHTDKSKDDPTLQAVLSQRTEGTGKQRRRRTNQMPSSA